jgi:aminomethyltransferase
VTRQSPLHDVHEALGASFTDFAGWLMPVRYSSDLAEHHAVRTAAGIFDISHMAEIRVTGPDAAAFLDHALAGLLSAVAVGKAKYSLILAASGGILDDLIVYHVTQGEYLVVANAGNRDVVVEALRDRSADFDVVLVDETDGLVLIAVQGPAARTIVDKVVPVPDIGYYACAQVGDILLARTGYTGEDGYELYVATDKAAGLWSDLMTAGAAHGLVPAGLASRDTLRLEAGMPLYGHELGLDTLPAQAGLGRVVNLTKDFVGRHAVEAGPADGARVLVGLVSEGKRAGRAGYPVMLGDVEVGTITSGALSPTLGYPIAMAYVDSGIEPGTRLDIDVRGSRVAASVVSLPFYKREV